MSLVGNAAQLARAVRLERWPVIGRAVRSGGRALNGWLYGDAGVPALVDGQIPIRISPRAFSGGAYSFDPRLTAELKRLALPGREFVDAGAHVGVASLVYAALVGPDTRIAAFEPNPNVFPTLVANSWVNGMRIECFRLALGDEIGPVDFFVDGADPNASLSREAPGQYWYWQTRGRPVMQACRAAMTTLDRMCGALGLAPGVIKLDVEGAELQVLRGATETVRRYRPTILMETHVFAWESFGYDRESLESQVAELDYRVCNGLGEPFDGPLGSGPERDNNHFLLLPR